MQYLSKLSVFFLKKTSKELHFYFLYEKHITTLLSYEEALQDYEAKECISDVGGICQLFQIFNSL